MSRLSLLFITNVKSISIIFSFLLLFSCSSDDTAELDEQEIINTTASIVEITNISENSATISGAAQAVQGSSILAKGVAWGTNNNPTVETDFSTDEGTNSGDFTSSILNLKGNTEYHIRAYVTTDVATFYSTDQTFTTLDLCNGGNVYNGDAIRLETQAEVETFGAMGYCEVNAGIRIGTIFNDSDPISDISSLSTIKKVKAIYIDHTLLYNLDPLQNLVYLEDVLIKSNPNLVNIDGLSNVVSSVNNIAVGFNPNLINIDGLSGLKSIETGLDLNGVNIFDNNKLQNIDGLLGLTSWKGGNLSIRYNPLITTINGLQNIESLDFVDVSILGNTLLQNIDGLQNVIDASNSIFEISSNPLLEELNGLSNIKTSLSIIYIKNQIKLTNLNSLSNLEDVDRIYLENNPSLTNLNGLSNINSTRVLFIRGNESLTNLNGLEGISTNLSSFDTINNNSLIDFCSLTAPFNSITIENYNVEGNAYNPSQQDIIDGNCSQ